MDDQTLIARLRELLAKATPRPWHFDGPPDNHIIWRDGQNRICFMAHSNGRDPDRDTATTALIVEAVNALPHLLARLEALTAERDAAVAARDAERERCAKVERLVLAMKNAINREEEDYRKAELFAAIRGEG